MALSTRWQKHGTCLNSTTTSKVAQNWRRRAKRSGTRDGGHLSHWWSSVLIVTLAGLKWLRSGAERLDRLDMQDGRLVFRLLNLSRHLYGLALEFRGLILCVEPVDSPA